ncbi:MAG: valine--tRNA ligase [Dehalococcoidia bacterium]|nr:valine--tRNA ligase [Dehalococcoidia bacterium]
MHRLDLPKAYEPREVEDRVYRFWLDKGYFTPKIDHSKKPFTIIMPPPNVTGELHLGHALTATLEDIMIRWHRMKGDPTLWLPSTDHAGIATQVVVERQLAAEGKTRHDIGREAFEKRTWDWAIKCRQRINDQHKKLGVSCDWTRDTFTLDPGPVRAVVTTFVNLYKKGLIYRGERIINWCPRCQTALSDLETSHKDTNGHLYHIKYPMVGQPGHVIVATTRPETMFGDVAVAVHPEEKRYADLVGKTVAIPVINRAIPVIADEAVDRSFGTGALKITPAHDPVDFEIAQRHNLPLVNIMKSDASLNREAGPYDGYDRFDCRKDLLSRLERDGLLVKIEPHTHAVGHCMRCGTVVEPWASQQWFVRTKPLAEPAIEVVKSGQITIIPEQFQKVYLNWMENIRDWCISRQLWWGHRIPAWYCDDCGKTTVVVEKPDKCAHCSSPRIQQDPDVLDTWFSSGLWPHSTLGWPDDTEDLRYFYPTTVMETAYDILFFWVARMIMLGIENTGQIPFRWVYLHGLIRDEKGAKMSKTRGNVINPLESVDKYGADALRFSLVLGTSAGNDVPLSSGKMESGRNFANKLWNASRYVIRSLPEEPVGAALPPDLPVEDRWILSRLDQLAARVNRLLEEFRFGEAEAEVYEFVWGEFCDWYIELAKIRLNQPGSPSPVPVLVHTLEASLRLLHPFMPFITEEIWQNLTSRMTPDARRPDSIMIAPYPVSTGFTDAEAENEMSLIIDIIRSIRNARAEAKIDPAKKLEVRIHAKRQSAIEPHRRAIEILARVQPLHIMGPRKEPPADGAQVLHVGEVDIVLPVAVDISAEKQRLELERESLQTRIAGLQTRLADQTFLAKAPPAVVEKERGKLRDSETRLSKIDERLKELGRART